jgi:hypothetical protein
MGMRSLDRTHVLERTHGAPMLRLAVAACAAEAAGLCVAVVFNLIDSASGRAGATGNAIAFIVVELIVAAAVAAVAVALLIAVAGLAGIFAPASLRALTRTDWPGRD